VHSEAPVVGRGLHCGGGRDCVGVAMDHVVVQDRYTLTEWWRKIDYGPWVQMDCSIYPQGKPPVVFLKGATDVTVITWIDKQMVEK
jgi:hypothetical protein